VAAHLAGHAALQLNSLVVVDVVQLLQNLSKKNSKKLFPRFSRNNEETILFGEIYTTIGNFLLNFNQTR
jgi:Ca2+-binding EF-hand superfamily protein